MPLPSAQIVVWTFEDTRPLNSIIDTPEEPMLGGMSIPLEDAGGRYGASAGIMTRDAFGNPLGTVYCPATVSFSGTATDPENGALSAAMGWHDKGLKFETGASVSFTCTEIGTHNIVAAATDSGRLTDTATVSIQINYCNPQGAACSVSSECCSGSCTKGGCK